MAGEGLKDLIAALTLDPGQWGGEANFGALKQDAATAFPPGKFRIKSLGVPETWSNTAFQSPSAADILKEARGGGTARVPIQQLLDGIDDTMIRAAAPAAESAAPAATSGAFSSFQPGSAGWRSMAQPMTSPWEGNVPMPKDPLAAAPSKVYPGWNAPFGAGSGPIGDGTKISSRVNLLSNATKPLADFDPTAALRGGLDDAAQAGASVADDVGATAIRAAPGVAAAAAPAIEAEAPALASAASRGMIGHTLDGLKALNLPWGKIALGGAALGGAAKLLGSLGQVPGYIIPNQMGEGGLGGDGISVESLDPEVNPQLPGRSPADGLDALPSPEELPGMPEEPEMSMDGDEPPPVTHTAPLEEPSAGLRTIQKGDTLSALLLGMGVPRADLPRVIGEIARGNGIANADQIMPGQQIDMNKRVAGENYRWNGGGSAAQQAKQALDRAYAHPIFQEEGPPGGPLNYDLIMGYNAGFNARPPPGQMFDRNSAYGGAFGPAPKHEREMPPRFPAGGSRYGR